MEEKRERKKKFEPPRLVLLRDFHKMLWILYWLRLTINYCNNVITLYDVRCDCCWYDWEYFIQLTRGGVLGFARADDKTIYEEKKKKKIHIRARARTHTYTHSHIHITRARKRATQGGSGRGVGLGLTTRVGCTGFVGGFSDKKRPRSWTEDCWVRSSWTFSRGSKHTSTYRYSDLRRNFSRRSNSAAGLEFTRACRNLRCVVTFPNCFLIPFVARVRILYICISFLGSVIPYAAVHYGRPRLVGFRASVYILRTFARRNSSRKVIGDITPVYTRRSKLSRKTFRFFLTVKRFQGIREVIFSRLNNHINWYVKGFPSAGIEFIHSSRRINGCAMSL